MSSDRRDDTASRDCMSVAAPRAAGAATLASSASPRPAFHAAAIQRSGGVIRRPAAAPCASCPYRRDAPSGVWAAEEYAKLRLYDRPAGEQPTGVFLCHQCNGRACGGWAGCHDTDDLLALRLAVLVGDMSPAEADATRRYVSPVPLFACGAEAAEHGMRDIDAPSPRAQQMAHRLRTKRLTRVLREVTAGLPHPARRPVDGDCLTWSPRVAAALRGQGLPAVDVSVAGWVDDQRRVLGFLHRVVLVVQSEGPTLVEHVVDVTARQFDPDLPQPWVARWRTYRGALAAATGVRRVTRFREPAPPVG